MIKKALILLIAIAPPLSAKIEFAGVFYLGNEGNFSLIDSDAGESSGWLREGQSFQGYKIESYDRIKEVLHLVSSDEHLDLKLRPAVVQAERIILRGNLKIGADKEVAIDNAVIVVGEETRFPIDDQSWMKLTVERTERSLPPGAVAPDVIQGEAQVDGERRPPKTEEDAGKTLYLYRMAFEEVNDAGDIVAVAAPRVSALPGRGFTIRDGKYSFTYEP